MEDLVETKKILELLRQTSTKEVIQLFLKGKTIPFSGTWDEISEKRVLPAAAENKITNLELVQLLRSAEEHGRQHVFLYRCSPQKAVQLMDRQRVGAALRAKGLEGLLLAPRILDQPDVPTFVDVRWRSAAVDLTLVVKVLETREAQHYVDDERSADGKILTKRYELRRERAVSVAYLHRDGLLELRISARSTGSKKYREDVGFFWARLKGLLDQADFSEVSFMKLKANVAAGDPSILNDKIRFSNSRFRNEDGTTLDMCSRGDDADLHNDAGASESMQAFVAKDGYCEASNFFFVKNADVSRDVHILLSGEVNEFAITADCDEGDYRYVLNEIQILNV